MSVTTSATRFIDRLRPLGRILDLSAEGWVVWGVSPMWDEAGLLHAFFSRWPQRSDSPDRDWLIGGQICHAVADRPGGPYQLREVLLEPGSGSWDHAGFINARIIRGDDGYLLSYASNRDGTKETEAIGLMRSRSLDGPWEKISVDRPVLGPDPGGDPSAFDSMMCSNPALTRGPDGRWWLYYKGRRLGELPVTRRLGVAFADRPEGPYKKYPGNPIIDGQPQHNVEDPFVWREPDGAYRMICHDLGILGKHRGVIFSSKDGLNWTDPQPGYPSVREMEAGPFERIETPQLLFTDGRPTHLFCNRGGGPENWPYTSFVFALD